MAMNFILPIALGALNGLNNKQKGQSTGQALLQGAAGGMGMKLPSRAAEVASMAPGANAGLLDSPIHLNSGLLNQQAQLPNSMQMLLSRQFGGMM